MLCVGTAGWSIPREHGGLFPAGASHLERYASVLHCAEINTSFYRPHRTTTYRRWAASTPDHFRFSVKLPKQISHENGLRADREKVSAFLREIEHLGKKLGPILVQLPPKQGFDHSVALPFLTMLRELHVGGPIVLEPRHNDWFSPEVDALLRSLAISRVIADPAPVPDGTKPGGDLSLIYYRLHGSPQTYYSSYSAESLATLSRQMKEYSASSSVWCIFDNTALGAAAQNAVALSDLLSRIG